MPSPCNDIALSLLLSAPELFTLVGLLIDRDSMTQEIKEQVSATEPDWSRETPRAWWDPPRRLLRSIRNYQRVATSRNVSASLHRKFLVLQHRFWSSITGAEIPLNTRIGGGLLVPHPNGVVIDSNAYVGPNCLIFQQVTIGAGGKCPGVPTIGGHVDIGAGAKLLGGITIGNHAKIGANAVVLSDVPERATAVGIPARIILPS